jgi:hypothetical protein
VGDFNNLVQHIICWISGEYLILQGTQAGLVHSLQSAIDKCSMAIADAGDLVPPKSTWFEPKLADGLLSHVLD